MSGDVVDGQTTGDDGGTATGADAEDADGGTATGGDDGGTTGSDGGDGTTGGDGGLDADTTSLDGFTDVDGGMSCSGTVCNGTCVDTRTNDNHCGSCNNACPSTASCKNGSCGCPQYHTLCGGTCVATNIDNDNCGSCGNDCSSMNTSTQTFVCNGGQCVDTTTTGCPDQTTYCMGVQQCIDTDTNPNHCGTCGHKCPSGEGCASGNCAPLVQLGNPPAKCKGKDPSINIGFNQNNKKQKCSGRVASTTFNWALCSCDQINLLNNYLFDAFNSKKGPYQPGGYGGSVGSNGKITTAKGKIYGHLWTSDSQGIKNKTPAQMEVFQEFHSNGPASYDGKGWVHGDAYINGDVTGGGPSVFFYSNLTVTPGKTIGRAIKTPNSTPTRSNVSVPTVCKRCKPGNQIPVKTIVKNHVNNNDNSLINLQKDALDQPGGSRVLKLPCGKYYLSKIDVSNKTTILATGRTALFIDGDVTSTDFITIRAKRSAELDVFVNGSVTLQNDARVGAPAFPALNRFYVNGPWSSFNNTALGAYIYAIDGGVDLKNNGEVYGGLYTQDLTTMNNTEIHYDREVLKQKNKCCVGKGKKCSSDGDCCKSLICGNGTCGCQPKGAQCSADSDCCKGRSCLQGTCGCQPKGASCSTDSDCCSGRSCTNGTCGGGTTDVGTDADTGGGMDADSGMSMDADGGTTCVQKGGSCSADSDCCSSLLCSSGTCGSTCTQEGGSCSSDGDCCSPLVCSSGTCGTSSCKNLYESCSSDSECCSGLCATSAGGFCASP